MRNKLRNKNVRKVYKKSGSYALTIPIEMIKKLKIREGQKVEFSVKKDYIIIKDWK